MFKFLTGLPHTQGIQENSRHFKILENLRETQGNLITYLNLGKLREFFIIFEKLWEVLRFKKNYKEIFFQI